MTRDTDILLDASGEECPVPVEMAAARLEAMAQGEVLRVRSTDPVSPIDFEAWCMRQPHEFLGVDAGDGVWDVRIRRG
jgi:tRNA 2-thiouridine synthesizing protein A